MKHVINWKAVVRRARPQPTTGVKGPDWRERGTVYRGEIAPVYSGKQKSRGFFGWLWRKNQRRFRPS